MSLPLSPVEYRDRTLNAIFLIVLGYLGYSVADLCSKYLQQFYSIWQVLGISALWGLAVTGGWLFKRHGARAFFPANLKSHLVRASFVLGTAFFMVSALRTLPLADFYGIVFTTPFLAMILSVVVLKEMVGWRRWTAAAVGFCGVFILAGPQFNAIGEGVVFAMIGAVCAACNMVALKKIGSGGPVPLYGFYPFLFIAVFHLGGLFLTGRFVPVAPEHYLWYLVHGPVVVGALLCISMGFSRAPETSVVAPFLYTQILWGVAFGWAFFQTMPTGTTWAGLALIIGSGLYSLWREYRRHHMI